MSAETRDNNETGVPAPPGDVEARPVTPPKRQKPAFDIVFEGPSINPYRVSYSDLGEALRAFGRLAAGGSVDEGETESSPDGKKLHLIGVKSGSAIYRVAGPRPSLAQRNLQRVGETLADPTITAENEYIINPIETLSKYAERLNCTISAREPGDEGRILARIEPGVFERLFAPQFIKGDTQFVARVQRIGGASRQSCGLKVPFRSRMLICSVRDRDLARQIGQLLYEHVVVRGEATWVGSTFAVYHFRIDEARTLKRGGVADGFRALREAGGHHWDDIPDPRSFLGDDMEGSN